MRPISTLRISISGVRGVVGDSLSPLLLNKFAQAFGTYSRGGTVVVGRDTRPSGEMVSFAVFSGLLSTGCEVVDIGIVPVPTIQFFVRRSLASGGIAITASHNPEEWNALKFIGPRGLFLDPAEARELLDIYHQGDFRRVWNFEIRNISRDIRALDEHISRILHVLGPIKRKMKVVVDPCNGAAYEASPRLLDALGCEVVPMNTDPSGIFPRSPEPLPDNIKGLCEQVKEVGADIGFAQDADADRLAVVDENGVPLGEDYTLALALRFILKRDKGPVVINLSTSRAVEDTARRYKVKVYRSKVGEVNVTEAMEERGAVAGGEGNGGVIWPRINFCRDSLTAMACVLHLLDSQKKKVSEVKKALPEYHTIKRKLELPEMDATRILEHLKNTEKERGRWNEADGLRFEKGRTFWHIRPSNTEPVLRLVVDAPTLDQAETMADALEKRIKSMA